MAEKRSFGNKLATVIFSLISVVYLIPIFEVLMNSFKANSFVNTDTFALPNSESFVGFANYIFSFFNIVFGANIDLIIESPQMCVRYACSQIVFSHWFKG